MIYNSKCYTYVFVSLSHVANSGGQSGSYEVTLKINGTVEVSKKVTLAAGDSEFVGFKIVKNTAGTYPAEVEKPVAPPPSKLISYLAVIGRVLAQAAAVVARLVRSLVSKWKSRKLR